MKFRKGLIIGLDFDGTCVTHEYPNIGRSIGAETVLRHIIHEGGKLVLNTMRSGQQLDEAVQWFKDNDIPLFGIQRNPDQDAWTSSPKAYAHLYIDDAGLGCPLIKSTKVNERDYVDWEHVSILLFGYPTEIINSLNRITDDKLDKNLPNLIHIKDDGKLTELDINVIDDDNMNNIKMVGTEMKSIVQSFNHRDVTNSLMRSGNKRCDNWFSNMHPMGETYVHEGIEYTSSENFYQAMKVEDNELRKEISKMTPHDSKKCYKTNPNKYPIRDSWDTKEKLRVMEQILRFKFRLGTIWHEMLIATNDEEIIEYNFWKDVFWGWDINLKRGSNHLGKILMKIREEYTRNDLQKFMPEQ